MPYDLASDQDREDRRKHLDIIQAVVARQAASSAATKGWAITLAAAIFGVALVRENALLIVLGVVAVVALSIADGMYLHNERCFRDLYDAVARNEVESFSMDLAVIRNLRLRNKSYFSWSVTSIYAPLIVAGILLFGIALVTGGDEPTSAQDGPRSKATNSWCEPVGPDHGRR
ncbi:hypothetical protein LG324_03345 [Phycicoccus jejuensis]|uniref:hypothetical protein n=1 Tax=Phycicoccus jejuensis TaxID=367299 RepID=UPI003850FEA0